MNQKNVLDEAQWWLILKCFSYEWTRQLKRKHFGKQCFWCNVLLIRPSDGTKKDANLIEIMYVSKLPKHAMIEIGLQVENSFAPILYFDINTVV